MLALEPRIVARLREMLPAAWTVKGLFDDAGKRDPDLFASVAFADADVPDGKSAPGVLIQPYWSVTLVARSSDPDGAEQLDAAFATVVAALQGWAPGLVAGRRWDSMRLVRLRPPPFPANGLVGLELAFSTAARYDGGQP